MPSLKTLKLPRRNKQPEPKNYSRIPPATIKSVKPPTYRADELGHVKGPGTQHAVAVHAAGQLRVLDFYRVVHVVARARRNVAQRYPYQNVVTLFTWKICQRVISVFFFFRSCEHFWRTIFTVTRQIVKNSASLHFFHIFVTQSFS